MLASEEKVIFVLIWASPFVSFPQIPQKEYLRSWDKSHWKASSGPLRANITKERNSLYSLTSKMLLELEIHLASELLISSEARHFLDYQSKFGT